VNVQCIEGAGQPSSIGILHVCTGCSCNVETVLSRDSEIAHKCQGRTRRHAEAEGVSNSAFFSWL